MYFHLIGYLLSINFCVGLTKRNTGGWKWRTPISQLWRLLVQILIFRFVDKNRGKNVIQVTWVLLLKAHCTVDCVTWLVTVLGDWLGAIKKRLIRRQGVAVEKYKLLFRIISLFLVISLTVLDFEVVAYTQGWHFRNTNLHIPHTSDFWRLFQMAFVA